jgi:hypothetical protein
MKHFLSKDKKFIIKFDPAQLKFPSAGKFMAEIIIEPVKPNPNMKDIMIEIDLRSAKEIFDYYTPKTTTKVRGNGRFYFSFKPEFIFERACVKFLISWHEFGVPSQDEVWAQITLKNPFTPLYYQGGRGERYRRTAGTY